MDEPNPQLTPSDADRLLQELQQLLGTKSEFHNRRRHLRFPTNYSCPVKRGDGSSFPITLCDLSQGGIRFKTHVAVRPGESFTFSFAFAKLFFRGKMEVRWVRKASNFYEVGCQFTFLDTNLPSARSAKAVPDAAKDGAAAPESK